MTMNRGAFLLAVGILVFLGFYLSNESGKDCSEEGVFHVSPRTFSHHVFCVGELEAKETHYVCSSLAHEQARIVQMVPEGTSVAQGEVLLVLDTRLLEEKRRDLNLRLTQQERRCAQLSRAEEWERTRWDREKALIAMEQGACELELQRVEQGDEWQELSRLQALVGDQQQKTARLQEVEVELRRLTAEEGCATEDLAEVMDYLAKEEEALTQAKARLESYQRYVYPLKRQKAQLALERCHARLEEASQAYEHRIGELALQREEASDALKTLQEQERSLRQEMEAAYVRAPASGVVLYCDGYYGGQRRRPRVGDSLIRNQPVLQLPNFSIMRLKARVRESEIGQLQEGFLASLEVEAFPNERFRGRLVKKGIVGLPDPKSLSPEKSFDLWIELENGQRRLCPGMTARATVEAGIREEVLAVPTDYLFHNGAEICCWIQGPDGLLSQPVEVGLMASQWAEIQGGLHEGDRVCSLELVQKAIAEIPLSRCG